MMTANGIHIHSVHDCYFPHNDTEILEYSVGGYRLIKTRMAA